MPGRAKVTRGPKKSSGKSASARDRVTALCLALPQTDHEVSGDHATYRVRGKVFAYLLDNHHGDGIVSVCVKSELGEHEDRARLDPERFYLPAHIGPRGWFGMRLDRGRVAWAEVAEILERSYRLTAPAASIAKLDGAQGTLDNRRRPRKAARPRG
jgi:phosphoribosylglycinamide formyltransferase-1